MLKGSTQWQVARGIIDHIVEQGLEPGARLSEQALAQQFRVSRTPVRAVLCLLHDTGVLERRPNQGYILRRRVESADDAGLGEVGEETLYERILVDILEGALERTMSQNALMRRYDVGRGELTATLRRMTREGLAEPAPGQGWTFVQFSAEIIQKGYRLRLILEPQVLLEPDFSIDEDTLNGLRQAHEKTLGELSEATAWSELFSLDTRFHETLAAGSGNELIVETIQKQNRIRRLNEFLGYERLDRVRESLQEHLGILHSLLEGDREWAAAQLRQHLRRSLNQSLRHYAQDIEDFRSGRRRLETPPS